MSNVWTNKEIAERVLTSRREYGLSQSDLASLLGISRNYLSLIERGQAANISLDVYGRLCWWIGIPEHKQDSIAAIVAEMYTSLCELAGIHGADVYADTARKLLARYRVVSGHHLQP